MRGRVVTTSFTPITAGGGVPMWNNHFRLEFPDSTHFSWDDVVRRHGDCTLPEWEKARILNAMLLRDGAIDETTIVVADGFWACGLEHLPRVVSVAHGIWSHLTADDARAGGQPEFPLHHAVQVEHRRRHLAAGKPVVAVSDFIADQMMAQWGFKSTVIGNGVDLDRWSPSASPRARGERPRVIHGVNDRSNENKGWSHIERVAEVADVASLDEAAAVHGSRLAAFRAADIVAIPSGFEGNSYFCLEALACGAPIVAYAVGLPYLATLEGDDESIGEVMARRLRAPDVTRSAVEKLWAAIRSGKRKLDPRAFAERHSLIAFRARWRAFLEERFG